MIAHHGLELARAAEEGDVALKFEAAVAGGIPVIKGLREGAAANVIERVYGNIIYIVKIIVVVSLAKIRIKSYFFFA
jgi:hypothetical protein